MIKGIIFDIGGVLVEDAPRKIREHIAALTGMSYSRVNKSFHDASWGKWKIGKISSDEFWNAFIDGLNTDTNLDVESLRKKACEFAEEVETMFSFAKEIKAKGYKLGIISNNADDFVKYEKKKFGIDAIFDAVIMSNEVGMPKPNQEIFKICLEKIGLKPAECIFIDNDERHVKVAKEIGMGAVLFKGQKQLKKDLEKMGVV